MARYIVTGADGFIGSHLCDRLISDGHDVIAFCHYRGDMALTRLSEHPRLHIVWGAAECLDTWMQMPREHIDGIFHLAACVDVAFALRLASKLDADGLYWNTNVVGTRCAIGFAAKCNTRLLLMSSSEIYGTPALVPIRECDAYNPQSPYAESKVIAELDCQNALGWGADIVIARPFNTYGPRQSTRGVIAKICRHAALGHGPLELGNVETKRDWMFVSDTVDGLTKIMERGRRGVTYNLGTGRSITVADAARMAHVEFVAGTGQDRGSAEVLILQADASRARAELGWNPEVILADGLALTIDSEISPVMQYVARDETDRAELLREHMQGEEDVRHGIQG